MNAVILYDDNTIAAKAYAMLERATRRADEALVWNVKPWNFSLLEQPPAAEAALEDAQAAHLMVLATRDQSVLPPRLLDWLEQWAFCRHVQDAALAVFDGAANRGMLSPASTPALSQFAERHGLSFIFSDVGLARDESASFRDELHERAMAQTPTMEHILEHSSEEYYRG